MEEGTNVIYSYVNDQNNLIVEDQQQQNVQIIEEAQEDNQLVLYTEGEGQEVLVYDDESGEYQRYVYIPNNENDNVIEQEAEQQEVVQEESKEEITETEAPKEVEKEEQVKTSVVLNQSAIGNLQPGTLIQCNKCFNTFLATEFEQHYLSTHENADGENDQEQVVIAADTGFKKCAVCQLPSRSKKEYLLHYKAKHPGYKLGCPQCPQTYHSPELLNVHFKHFHERQAAAVQPAQPKRAHVLLRCEYCDDIVEDLESHLVNVHELDEPTALAVTQDRPVQLVFQGSQGRSESTNSRSANNLVRPATAQAAIALHCNICTKDFATQREFTNHRRRKDFCKPIYDPNVPVRQEPKKIRRIGIIRKEIQK